MNRSLINTAREMNVEQAIKLNVLNKKIVEIKKKIQLSEGQRKALFEDCEAERKTNADEVLQLKKEISNLVVLLHESVTPIARYRLPTSRLEYVLGPLSEKITCEELKEMLDLQIIDQSKKIDLLRYKISKRQERILTLGEEYQKLASKQEKKQLEEKIDKPVSKSTQELQNNIHAVEVQIREAIHIRNKYSNIRRSLKDDAAKFESRIKALEEEIEHQNTDISKLNKILDEATKRRGKARETLLKEEKTASAANCQRELEASTCRKLLNEKKDELEMLERRLFITGKVSTRPEPEGAEAEPEEDNHKSPTPPHPIENKTQEFDLLKQATGGTTTQEVLARFQAQKDTQTRLNELRVKLEQEKQSIEKNIDTLKLKLEGYRYSETRDAEKKSSEMDRLQAQIEEQKLKSEAYKKEKIVMENGLQTVLLNLHNLRLLVNRLALPENDPGLMLPLILNELNALVEKHDKCRFLDHSNEEITGEVHVADEGLPTPYSGLVKRPLQPPSASSPGPAAMAVSDEEEEVPSRSYLKRQAQLVIDAKSRRRNLRMHLPKRN